MRAEVPKAEEHTWGVTVLMPRAPQCHAGRTREPPPLQNPTRVLTLQGVEDSEEVELGHEDHAKGTEGRAPGGAQQAGEPQHRHPVPPRPPLLLPCLPQHHHHGHQHQHVEQQDEASIAQGHVVGGRAGEPAPGGDGGEMCPNPGQPWVRRVRGVLGSAWLTQSA